MNVGFVVRHPIERSTTMPRRVEHLSTMLISLCALFATLACALPRSQTTAQTQPDRVRESVLPPPGWKRTARAGPDAVIHLHIGLKHDGFPELERRLYEVSTPSHENYGRHLSGAEVAELLQPSTETLRLAEEWLRQHGITNYDTTPGRDWIRAVVPVRQAEALVQGEYHEFESDGDGDVLVRTLEWSLPGHLRDHVDVVQPTTSFLRAVPQDRYGGVPPPAWDTEGRVPTYDELVAEDLVTHGALDVPTLADLPAAPTAAEACNRLAMSALCLRVLYGTLDYAVQDAAGANRMGVVNFLGHNNNRSDIGLYLARYRPDAAAAGAADAFETVLLAGAADQQTPNTPAQMAAHMGIEGALDVETLLGLAFPVPLVAWNVGGRAPQFRASPSRPQNTNEPYLAWLQHLAGLADTDLPRVVSVSYADEERTVPPRYAARVCEALAQLGARGVSVLVASGDAGVGPDDDGCRGPDGAGDVRFVPSFPASCPFVTAVGGTRYFDPVMVGFDARGSKFRTGGGFSDYFPRPRYQEAAVGGYIEGLGAKHRGLYNAGGRGIPDVAAAGYHYPVVWNGTSHLLDGTSAATPAFAAVVALLNDALLAAGRPPLGFLNPWLYGPVAAAARAGLRDVTIGSNRGCDTDGFPAAEGWDAATGLGTPWFPVLKHLALGDAFRWDHPWYMVNLA